MEINGLLLGFFAQALCTVSYADIIVNPSHKNGKEIKSLSDLNSN